MRIRNPADCLYIKSIAWCAQCTWMYSVRISMLCPGHSGFFGYVSIFAKFLCPVWHCVVCVCGCVSVCVCLSASVCVLLQMKCMLRSWRARLSVRSWISPSMIWLHCRSCQFFSFLFQLFSVCLLLFYYILLWYYQLGILFYFLKWNIHSSLHCQVRPCRALVSSK